MNHYDAPRIIRLSKKKNAHLEEVEPEKPLNPQELIRSVTTPHLYLQLNHQITEEHYRDLMTPFNLLFKGIKFCGEFYFHHFSDEKNSSLYAKTEHKNIKLFLFTLAMNQAMPTALINALLLEETPFAKFCSKEEQNQQNFILETKLKKSAIYDGFFIEKNIVTQLRINGFVFKYEFINDFCYVKKEDLEDLYFQLNGLTRKAA